MASGGPRTSDVGTGTDAVGAPDARTTVPDRSGDEGATRAEAIPLWSEFGREAVATRIRAPSRDADVSAGASCF